MWILIPIRQGNTKLCSKIKHWNTFEILFIWIKATIIKLLCNTFACIFLNPNNSEQTLIEFNTNCIIDHYAAKLPLKSRFRNDHKFEFKIEIESAGGDNLNSESIPLVFGGALDLDFFAFCFSKSRFFKSLSLFEDFSSFFTWENFFKKWLILETLTCCY